MADKNLITDALGLNVAHNCILAAVGNHAFLLAENIFVKLPQRVHHKKVHGFALSHADGCPRLLLVYSENEFSLYKYDLEQKEIFQLIYKGETKDWINAASFLKNVKNFEFVLHMSHGALLHLRYTGSDCNILEVACSTDYSMLYHTSLYGFQYRKLTVISGNGFGEILIWQPRDPININSVTCCKTYPLRLRLKAHNGVIFSIDYNLTAQLLVSTSDDRSIKFWHLDNVSDADCIWFPGSVKPMFSCFGHFSRVICAIIITYEKQVFVVSGGEDSYICIWSQSGDMIFKRRQQFGAPIWRLDYDSNTFTLYTTSSSGSILAYNLSTALKERLETQLTMLMPMNITNEFVRNIRYLDGTTIIALSSKNRLFYMRLSESIQSKVDVWKLVPAFPAYKCTVLTVYDKIVATCGYQRVTVLSYDDKIDQFQKLYDGAMLEGLIKSFHFLNKHTYLVSDAFGNCLILKSHTMEIKASIKISNCREPWITNALLVAPTHLLISLRNGHVMLYSENSSNQFELKDTLKYVHGNMGSNMLKLLKCDEGYAYVLSAGHEPVLKHIRISYKDHRLAIMRRECVPLAWVDASPTLDMFIGFNDDHLVAWSPQNDVLLELQCGGGHRSWDFQLKYDELHIIYVKQKHVFFHRQILQNRRSDHFDSISRTRWHTRNCNIIELIKPHNNNSQPYIVSAGDDNIIKINQLSGQSLIQMAELHTHISSVRHLISISYGKQSLIFSVGGRAQLCINQLDSNGPVIIISELCSHSVRANSSKGSKSISPDARLMSIQVFQHLETGRFSLYLASADGTIRLMHWHFENPSEIHLVRQIDIERCPLQMQLLNNCNLLLITTTSGMLYAFDHSLCSKRFCLQLHAAGINALDALASGNVLHVVSGGDDENVKHTTIDLTDMSIKHSTEFRDLHNAQVNALTLHVCRGIDKSIELCAYTCSTDKQIFKLNLTTQQNTRVGFTCISDVKGMLFYNNKYLYIYGSGLHVMTVNPN